MGIPQPGYDISQRPDRKLGQFHYFLFVTVSKCHEQIAIVVAYLMGIVGFVYVLGRWTSTEGTLYWN